MNHEQFAGKWKQFVGKAKQRWGALTGNDALERVGRHQLLIGRIREQRGLSEAQAERQLHDFLYRHRNWRQS